MKSRDDEDDDGGKILLSFFFLYDFGSASSNEFLYTICFFILVTSATLSLSSLESNLSLSLLLLSPDFSTLHQQA